MLDIISDYNTKLSDDINALYANIRGDNGNYLSHSYRAIECNELIERYFSETGEVPKSNMLDRMATYILKEDTFGRKGYKKPPELEFPILSATQYKRRISREMDWEYAKYFDINGNDLTIKTRSQRISNELSKGKVK